MEVNKVYCENCLDTMIRMPDNFIDLTITSPPYDGLRTYNGYSFPFEEIAKELYRVTKIGGVIVWVVGDQTKDGTESGTSFRQALYFKEIGFNLHDTMIYRKINYIPLTHNRYEQEFEYMFILTKRKLKTFNPIRENCKTPNTLIHRINTGKVKEAATRSRDEVTVTKQTKYRGNVWEYVVGSKRGETGNHPAAFPEQLASDHIISWSNEGDLIYDPFMGSGTVAKQAIINNRNYIGSEISSEYCDIIDKRLSNIIINKKSQDENNWF